MPVSDDTILRQLKRDAALVSCDATIRVVGIDDWSWRRTRGYGKMIVDLERRLVVDILGDRSVASVARWLERHRSVEIVSRDRCGLYAQAAREGAPQARQVADHFHLMQNLRVAIEEQMSLAGRATGRALLPHKSIGSAQIDPIEDDPHVDAMHRRRVRHAHQQSRQAVFDTVHALNKHGLCYSEVARRTGYGRRSIAKWLTFETPPDRQKAALKPTSPYIRGVSRRVLERWQSLRTASVLRYQTARLHGQFLESRAASRKLAPLGEIGRGQRVVGSDHLASTGPRCCPDTRSGDRPCDLTGGRSCPLHQAAKHADDHSGEKGRCLETGLLMRSLGMRFRGIFRSRDPDRLDSWIDDAVNSGLVAIERFARFLHRDLDAVYNAIELPWSNGQAEGQINRLKTIKRAMYGRAGPELLRARMLPLEQNRHHTK
nr:ISL3 family transposase [Sinorhizobium medicae]